MKNSAKRCSAGNKIRILYLTGFLLLILSAVIGILIGSSSVRINDIADAFLKGFNYSPQTRVFAYVRLPRTVASLVCGGALAVSGAIIQSVLANRLASPSIIGVNSGAGLAVTLSAFFGIYGGFRLSVFAFLGAFITVMLVSFSAQRLNASRGTVILIGVAVNSFFGAITSAVITFIPEIGVMSNDFKVGEFSAVTFKSVIPSAVIIIIALMVVFTLVNELDVLALGDESAAGLGMNTRLVRSVFLTLSALLAGCAVSIAGLLSFVGLIVPNIIRNIVGGKSSYLLPLCALFGSSFVCLCDTVARIAFSPYEIPVGIIMAFLGAPFFVFILVRRGLHRRD